MAEQKIYFTAGPAKLPDKVMEQVHAELLNYQKTDISVLEMSHRSAVFDSIIKETEADLRRLLKVPDNYAVMFMHGGARSQFDSAPMNLCSEADKHSLDYLVTGTWSKIAATEAEKYAKVNRQLPPGGNFNCLLAKEELVSTEGAVFRYYCDNETIQGVEFNYVPESGENIPLVCDMTSNFLSRPVDISKFGIVFAGTQKNCGIAGLAIVIVRRDLIGRHMKITPSMQNYKITSENNSLYNTPLTFAIYVTGLCVRWIEAEGGLEVMDRISKEKSGLIYDTIDNSAGFYTCPVAKSIRSRMNVVFLISNKDLDSKFMAESKAANLFELKGHRSVGGFRASLYHGVTMDNVKRLVRFMTEFRQRHSS